MENLKTQTVKHTYEITFRCAAEPEDAITFPVTAESVSAALKTAARGCTDNSVSSTYDVSVCLADAPSNELYANTLVAPDAYTFLRKCAEDAAMIAFDTPHA